MTQPDPPLSNWQIYQQLAQMLAKLDVLIAQGADHEARLRLLEKGRWPQGNITQLVGIGGFIVAIAAVLVAVFKH